jgi:hypothetical protein
VVLALATAGSARAEPRRGAQGELELSRRHFLAGSAAYERNDWAAALEEFEAAQRARPAPELDFNIARCYEHMERLVQALAAYGRFASARPGPEGDEAREHMRQLSARLAPARPPEPPPLVVEQVAPAPRPIWRRPVTWVLVGVAAALVVAAITVGAVLGSATTDPTPSIGALRIN